MGDFTTQSVISDGSGDFHLNRFRIAFEPPAGVSVASLASDIVDRFPEYLRSEFATVEFAGRYHEGNPTLHFHGYAKLLGIDLAAPHDDWVARVWADRSIGFTAQTLKREFFVLGDDVAGGAGGGALGAVVATLFPVLTMPIGGAASAVGIGAGAGVETNRMHFLAGRRSWRISEGTVFGLSGDVIVLETVAVERLSSLAYRFANAIIGLESKVPDVWIALLNNFVNMKRLKVVPQGGRSSQWRQKNRVDYVQLSFGDLGKMLADPEFKDVHKLYPTVFPLNAFAEKWVLAR